MPPAAIPALTLAVTAAGVGVGAYEQQKASTAAKNARNIKPPELPKQAQVASFATDQQKAQTLAMTAGGTIFSDQSKNRASVGSGPATGTKSLIGA